MRTTPWIVAGTLFCGISVLFSQESDNDSEAPPWPLLKPLEDAAPLPGTHLLEAEDDLSHRLVMANDAFLDEQIVTAARNRARLWKPGSYDPDERRLRLSRLLGLDRDSRPETSRLEYYSVQKTPRASGEGFSIYHVRWKTIGALHGEGLLLEPKGKKHPILADVIALPDADQSPEAISGLADEDAGTTPYALLLAQSGCRVLVPTLIHRDEIAFRMTQREFLHRSAFVLGRHLLGYELHKVLSGVDALAASQGERKTRPIGVIGFGEGGLLALYAGALDNRFAAVGVSGYFGPRETLWKEPAEHNIHGLLTHFGDAEIASLVSPRSLVIESGVYPDFAYLCDESRELQIVEERTPSNGKPGRFFVPTPDEVDSELSRLRKLSGDSPTWASEISESAISPETLVRFVAPLGIREVGDALSEARPFQKIYPDPEDHDPIAERQARQGAEIDRHNQWALIQSRQDRQEYFADLDTESLESFAETIEPYREHFRTEVIGDFELELLPPNARTRPYQEGLKTRSYEVVLDVFEGVMVYGILTLPKDLDLDSGQKRPVVVCQHGLEGSPQDVIGESKFKAYAAFATQLAERGFITFAPQNGYKYFDRFRLQQFKSQSMGKTLFSIIVPQHLQITDWLAGQEFVDADRIAFYGLSYGGKSAMRIPPLVDRYCLSICSADFNEWVWKNAATDPKSLRYSYANKGEYEIFEWNLGGTFNYAEMAALICPRPFLVERGHFDGVAPDETVGYEFAKVRHLYQAQLGIGDRCEIEWFVGPHSIHGERSYDFLAKHLEFSAESQRNELQRDVRERIGNLSEEERRMVFEHLRERARKYPDESRNVRLQEMHRALLKLESGKPLP